MVKRYKLQMNAHPNSNEKFVLAYDYDEIAAELAACKVARDGWTKASDAALNRIRELEAQQAKLVRAVAEARGQSGLLKADKRICELEAVLRTVPHEPGSLIAKVLAGSAPSDATHDRGVEHG